MSAPRPETSTRGPAGDRRLALTFDLGGDAMAIDVHHVAEVLEPLPLTPVPGACRAAPALTNVRGAVVPVIDLRRRLDLPTAESAPTRLIVLDLATADEPTRLAFQADDVDRIIEIDGDAVEPVPLLGLRWAARFTPEVTRHEGRIVFFVDPMTAFEPANLLPGGAEHQPARMEETRC